MYKCKICGKEFETQTSLGGHVSSHNRGENYKKNRKKEKLITDKKYICKYCRKEFDNGWQLGGHQSQCLSNPKSIETKKKIGNTLRGKPLSKTHKRLISIAMKKAINDHPESYSSNNVCGRTKLIKYNGFTLNGKWELNVAEFLDDNNIKWTNIIDEEIYYKWNGKNHRYFPDFYLEDFDLYIEVKGYQRDRDIEKWKSLNNLIILKNKEISKIQKGELDINYIIGE